MKLPRVDHPGVPQPVASKKATEPAPRGRPPRASAPSTTWLKVRLTPEEYELYTRQAAEQGTTITQVVRDYLRRWAAQARKR